MGEALLRDRLARRGIDARVSSAGLLGDDVPASDGSVRAMTRRGLDLSAHRSRRLTAEAIDAADLVLGMAREHVREAVVLVPDALGRTFTLREVVRRAEAVGPRRPVDRSRPDLGLEPFDAWLARVGEGRRPSDLLGSSPDDDVEDPMGMSRRAYERTAVVISDLVDRLVDLAFPAVASYSA